MEGILNTLMIDFLIQSHSREFMFTKDIPFKYIVLIENFCKVSSVKDIENAMKNARNLVFQIISEIEK